MIVGLKLREILRFEAAYHLRRPTIFVCGAVLVILCLLRADASDVGLVFYNAPIQIAFSTLTVGLMAILVTAVLFVEPAQRDLRSGMHPLFYTLPLKRREYLGGRFVSTYFINAALLLLVPAGLLLGSRVVGGDPGLYRLEAYFVPYLIFLLPNLLVNSVILYGVTLLTGRSLDGYLAGLGLTALYLFAALTAGPEQSRAMAMLDPTGAVALASVTAGWTRLEQNTRMIFLEGPLLWNRILWMTVATAMLGWVCARFRFAHAELRSRRRTLPDPPTDATTPLAAPIPATAHSSFGFRTIVHQAVEVTRLLIRQTLLRRDFILVMCGLAALSMLMLLDGTVGGVPHRPLTVEVASELTSWTLPLLVALLTAFYVGEMIWLARDAGTDHLVDCAPVGNEILLAGTLGAMGVMLVVIQIVIMMAGVVSQALQGHFEFDLLLYLKIMFGMQLPNYLLFGVLALFVHVFVNQKLIGHMISALLWLAFFLAGRLGIEHTMLIYGSDPGWRYSDLNGFGPFLRPFVWFKLYWMSVALLLGLFTLLLWNRSRQSGVRPRAAEIRHRFSPRVGAGFAAATLMLLVTGGVVFYNTNVLNDYRTRREVQELHAEYERRYKKAEQRPQPRLDAIRLNAELYPEEEKATILGTYTLINETAGTPIDEIHLSLPASSIAVLRGVQFDRPARPLIQDETHHYRTWQLQTPLQPGDRVQMDFELAVERRGFRHREPASTNLPLIGDFTSLSSRLLPAIGYQRANELSDATARIEQGLPPAPVRPSIDNEQARRVPRIPRVHFEATVATSLDQTALLPGRLKREWVKDGRRYFEFASEAPILNFFSVLAGDYELRQRQWSGAPDGGDVLIRLLHAPGHDTNADYILRSAETSLSYLEDSFGSYPHGLFTMVEVPRYGGGARAYGTQMEYSERSPLRLARVENGQIRGVDGILVLTAHELAHQWWGQQVMGADVEGSQMLSETLAQYSAIAVLERERPAEQARAVLRRMQLDYLNGRARHRTPEVPLMLTADHSYLHYGKGAVAMHTLKDYIGEEKVNSALRSLVRKHGMKGPPFATTRDLYRELEAVTPESLHYLLEDMLATITFWDLHTVRARTTKVDQADYLVTLDVQAAKLRADREGRDREVPMDELVEVGVFAKSPTEDQLGEPLYLAKHRIRSGQQTITVRVSAPPHRAGVDPYHKLIVRRTEALLELDAKVPTVVSAGEVR